jgi:hypothetical protein
MRWRICRKRLQVKWLSASWRMKYRAASLQAADRESALRLPVLPALEARQAEPDPRGCSCARSVRPIRSVGMPGRNAGPVAANIAPRAPTTHGHPVVLPIRRRRHRPVRKVSARRGGLKRATHPLRAKAGRLASRPVTRVYFGFVSPTNRPSWTLFNACQILGPETRTEPD